MRAHTKVLFVSALYRGRTGQIAFAVTFRSFHLTSGDLHLTDYQMTDTSKGATFFVAYSPWFFPFFSSVSIRVFFFWFLPYRRRGLAVRQNRQRGDAQASAPELRQTVRGTSGCCNEQPQTENKRKSERTKRTEQSRAIVSIFHRMADSAEIGMCNQFRMRLNVFAFRVVPEESPARICHLVPVIIWRPFDGLWCFASPNYGAMV